MCTSMHVRMCTDVRVYVRAYVPTNLHNSRECEHERRRIVSRCELHEQPTKQHAHAVVRREGTPSGEHTHRRPHSQESTLTGEHNKTQEDIGEHGSNSFCVS